MPEEQWPGKGMGSLNHVITFQWTTITDPINAQQELHLMNQEKELSSAGNKKLSVTQLTLIRFKSVIEIFVQL